MHEWPGTGDALVRRSPRADGNIRYVLRSLLGAKEDDVRNSTYSSSVRKTANLTVEAKYDCAHAWCNIHAAHFHILVSTKVLSGASAETGFRECAALLLPPAFLS